MSESCSSEIEVVGRHHVAHAIESVWTELNNPRALKFCIRQCRELERVSRHRYRARLQFGIGPVRVPVSANLDVMPQSPPEHYRLSCSMSLKPFGAADGKASVRLSETAGGVILEYHASIDFHGRLAAYGAPFIDEAVARNMKRFFGRFDDWMAYHARSVPEADA